MVQVNFHALDAIADARIRFVVIAVRCPEGWVFCRHKARATWEFPGGHREKGETVAEAARRELYEETGITGAELRQVAVYSVTNDQGTNYGMLCFAETGFFPAPPEKFEIGETTIRDLPPEELTYPEIVPALFEYVQGWLNLQSNADELWDVYDENRNPTGRLHRRGDPMAPGDYHLAVHVWMRNAAGKYLITKRAPNKGYSNMWESTGGSALAGDDSLTAALREVREETGLTLNPDLGRLVLTVRGRDCFCDVWLFRQDFDLRDVVLQEGETCGAKYAGAEEILAMADSGTFVPLDYLRELLEMEDTSGNVFFEG